jgi:hypothetical protein
MASPPAIWSVKTGPEKRAAAGSVMSHWVQGHHRALKYYPNDEGLKNLSNELYKILKVIAPGPEVQRNPLNILLVTPVHHVNCSKYDCLIESKK